MIRHRISGQECIKILCKEFGFSIVRQRGSHIVLKKHSEKTIVTVVPDHHELKIGTLKKILRLAEVGEEEFMRFL